MVSRRRLLLGSAAAVGSFGLGVTGTTRVATAVVDTTLVGIDIEPGLAVTLLFGGGSEVPATVRTVGPPPVDPPSRLHEACSYAYGRVIGLPHDPTVLGLDLPELGKTLRDELERGVAIEPASYRAPPALGLHWAQTFVAHQPDLDATARALTLARIDVAATENAHARGPKSARALAVESFERVRAYFDKQHSSRLVEIERQRRSMDG